MPDYIYLLENRLSADQQNALHQLREAAREAGTILFLTGDAVRDLTSGHSVRDLEVAVHGNALSLRKSVEKLGGTVWGEDAESRSLYLCFPGTVRVDLVSTHRAEFQKPGKIVYYPASIQEYLRHRDFTVNAMAISLNEGSFGLLMDPFNGAADIESRTIRLVSNYGFLEKPSLLIRATRYMARLGWEMDPRTRTRYENAREEGVIEHLSSLARSRELEQIGHEEDGLKVLKALESEGWMKFLFPAWTSAKADEEKLKALHELAVELILAGVHPDMSAAQMHLLTDKLAAKDLASLKKLMLRPGFVEEWSSLDALAAGFAKVLLAKENTTPSTSYRLFTSYDPEAILWLGFISKDAAVKERFNLFLKVWPETRQRIPHALMQEMRITPELAAYGEIADSLFLQLLDGNLATPEEMRAFLEPYSPPAPPPQVTVKRPRAKRGAEAKLKEHSFEDEEEPEEVLDEDEDLDDIGDDEEDAEFAMSMPKVAPHVDAGDEAGSAEEEGEEEAVPAAAVKRASKAAKSKPAAPAPAKAQEPAAAAGKAKPHKAEKPEPAPKHGSKPAAASVVPQPKAKPAAASVVPQPKAKPAAAPARKSASVAKPAPKVPVKATAVKPPVKPTVTVPAKPPVKVAAKVAAKVVTKAPAKVPATRLAPAHKKPVAAPKHVKPAAKQVAKKPAPKPARKH
jgi:tRNA nucleotidyltransferase (CCA-adding enzyme)